MGASEWDYWVPYREDVAAALQALRDETFRKGEFYRSGRSRPATIKELIERNAEDGTHSIIDIETVSGSPTDGAVAPLTSEELDRLFGTTTPSREEVETRWQNFLDVIDWPEGGWLGRYVVTYRDGKPHELFFFGISGD